MENFIQHGFKRLVFVNGHGGNIVPGQQTIFEVRQRHRDRDDLLLLFSTYWTVGGEPWRVNPDLKQTRMGHACEWETSMMLRIAPHLVGDWRTVEDVDWGNAFERHRTVRSRRAHRTGTHRLPARATAEKGETLFQVFSAQVVALLEHVLAWDGRSWSG